MLLKIHSSKKYELRAMNEIFAAFPSEGSSMKDYMVSAAYITSGVCAPPVRSMHFHQGFTFSWKITVIQEFSIIMNSCEVLSPDRQPGRATNLSVPFPATYLLVQN